MQGLGQEKEGKRILAVIDEGEFVDLHRFCSEGRGQTEEFLSQSFKAGHSNRHGAPIYNTHREKIIRKKKG